MNITPCSIKTLKGLYDISGVEVGQHFYWQIGGFQIHAQVLITSWVVITILLGSVIIAVRNPQTISTDGQNFFEYVVDASDGRQVIDIVPPGPELLVSEGESIKLDQPLTSNPNVGAFGPGDAEIVLQDPLRVQGLLFFFASVILAQVFLVLKKKQFEKIQLYEMNFFH